MKQTRNQLRATAYHEAGHAVAAFVHGLIIKQVSIEPGDDSLGHFVFLPPKRFNPELGLPPAARIKLENRIIGLFAGHCAEKRFTGRNNNAGARHDDHAAGNMGSYLHPDGDVLRLFLEYLHKRAEALVANQVHWAAICSLARALVAKNCLSGDEAVNAIRLGYETSQLRHIKASTPSSHAGSKKKK